MEEYYNNNSNFKQYVDSYRRKHNLSVEEALSHELVKLVYLHYKKEVGYET